MKKVQLTKLELVCEECGFQTEQLEVRKHIMYCNECADAQRRRERLKKADKEWEEFDKVNEAL